MPILWKYLLKNYFQFLLLCVSAFVAVLLVIRFQEIALFASSGASIGQIGLFSLYQVPYILPLALPVSCLIASMILFQKMSFSLELTALRSCGISLKQIALPLLISTILLSLLNFSIASEITPITRTKAKNLIYAMVADNPLIVMQKDSMLNIKTVEFDVGKLKLGKKAEDVIGIMRQDSTGRISLFTAKEIVVDKDHIQGKNLSVISTAEGPCPGYDHLFIENQKSMQANKKELTSHLLNTEWFSKEDLLNFRSLLTRIAQGPFSLTSKSFLELARRVCLGLCPFTFTLIGIAFGTHIGRTRKKKALFSAFFLTTSILLCFVTTKTAQTTPLLVLCLYLLPQPAAWLVSARALSRASKGVES